MLIGFATWMLAASLVTAVLYVWDKRAASKNRNRVSEKTLLIWSVLGGWPGGLIAGQLVRHKTSKLTYRIKFAACIVLNLAAIGLIAWMTLQ